MVSSTSSAITVKLKGVLIPINVSPVLQDLPISGTYTVPAGKTFYFGLLREAHDCSGNINIAGFVDSIKGGKAGIMTAGQTLTNNTDCLMVLNGYLR